jgi:hypothetical protein
MLCCFCSISFAEPPDYSWHHGNKATLGKDGKSWLKLYVGTDIIAEGSTDNGSETTITFTDPTRDNTIIVPDGTGTVAMAKFVDIYFGSSSSKTLSTSENTASTLRGYGTTSTCTITAAPVAGQVFVVVNGNTGSGVITMKISGGTGTTIAVGSTSVLYANGTNTDITFAK